MRRSPLSDARVREIAGGYSLTHDVESVPLAEEVIEARRDARRDATAALLNHGALKRLKQRIDRYVYDPLRPARLLRRDINDCIEKWAAAERKRGGR